MNVSTLRTMIFLADLLLENPYVSFYNESAENRKFQERFTRAFLNELKRRPSIIKYALSRCLPNSIRCLYKLKKKLKYEYYDDQWDMLDSFNSAFDDAIEVFKKVSNDENKKQILNIIISEVENLQN